jgi:hypothetical protein
MQGIITAHTKHPPPFPYLLRAPPTPPCCIPPFPSQLHTAPALLPANPAARSARTPGPAPCRDALYSLMCQMEGAEAAALQLRKADLDDMRRLWQAAHLTAAAQAVSGGARLWAAVGSSAAGARPPAAADPPTPACSAPLPTPRAPAGSTLQATWRPASRL